MRPIALTLWNRTNCLCAGSSALLLNLAHTHPELWYFSLIALVPFLWRLLQVSLAGSVCLATTLATVFVLATYGSELLVSPGLVLFKLLAFNIAFVLFALGINRAKRSIGFDPLMIALLWFPIEFLLITCADVGSVFSISATGSKTVLGFCTMFGFVLGSLVVVLINALILWIFKCIEQKTGSYRGSTPKDGRVFVYLRDTVSPECGLHYLLGPRAPPAHMDRIVASI